MISDTAYGHLVSAAAEMAGRYADPDDFRFFKCVMDIFLTDLIEAVEACDIPDRDEAGLASYP